MVLVTRAGATTQPLIAALAADLGLEVVPVADGPAPASAQLAVIAQDGLGDGSIVDVIAGLGELPSVAVVGPISRASYGQLVGKTAVRAVVADTRVELGNRLRAVVSELTGKKHYPTRPASDGLALSVSASEAVHGSLESISRWCSSAGVRRRIHDAVVDISDELLTNAIYNAPMDSEGSRPYEARSRRQGVELEPEHGARLNVWVSRGGVTISCVDPFGSLPEARARTYIAKGMTRAAGQVSTKAGGAGLGLARVVEIADLCEVRVSHRRRTEIRVTLDLHRRRSWSQQAPGLFLAFG